MVEIREREQVRARTSPGRSNQQVQHVLAANAHLGHVALDATRLSGLDVPRRLAIRDRLHDYSLRHFVSRQTWQLQAYQKELVVLFIYFLFIFLKLLIIFKIKFLFFYFYF